LTLGLRAIWFHRGQVDALAASTLGCNRASGQPGRPSDQNVARVRQTKLRSLLIRDQDELSLGENCR